VMGFELVDRPIEPKAALVDRRNQFVRWLTDAPALTAEAALNL